MNIRWMTMAVLVALFATGAQACKTNSDCRQPGTRCINADQPNAILRFCGPWHSPDSKPISGSILGPRTSLETKGSPS